MPLSLGYWRFEGSNPLNGATELLRHWLQRGSFFLGPQSPIQHRQTANFQQRQRVFSTDRGGSDGSYQRQVVLFAVLGLLTDRLNPIDPRCNIG